MPHSPRSPAVQAIRGPLPSRQAPQLATAADQPPEGDEWVSELKLDGYRLLVWIEHGRARIVTRNGHDWTPRMPRLAERFAALGVETALLDGEMVALQPDGTSSFHDLQAALADGRDGQLHFYAFDLLHLNGWDLRPAPLLGRKHALEAIPGWNEWLRFSGHIQGAAAALQGEACRLKVEGIVAKRASAPYQAGRSTGWLKVKCQGREEFVVVGWTPPGGSRPGIGALALGFYDPAGQLHFAGAAGSGFSERDLVALRARLEPLRLASPRTILAAGDPPDRAIHWVRPELVAEISFTAWSGEGRVRHGVFLGLREDKAPAEVVRPVPNPLARRHAFAPAPSAARPAAKRWKGAIPPLPARTG